MKSKIAKEFLHFKCRNTEKPYLHSKIFRQIVPDEKVPWSVVFLNYNPPVYNSNFLIDKSWSDSNNIKNIAFNSIDVNINRKSHSFIYKLNENGYPLNPMGRTGLCGRGILGRWGPNHAADPLVSQFINDQLQFVAIQRSDTVDFSLGEWAIPGGMVDIGEDFNSTLVREFTEEALNGQLSLKQSLNKLWEKGIEIYRGYVDDARNTDNAWIETVVVNYHDNENLLENVSLKADDDAINVKWVTVGPNVSFYASHNYFIKLLAKHHKILF